MIELVWGKPFEKKYIRKHPEKEDIIEKKLNLFEQNPFAPELRNHGLTGKVKDLRAISIDYDCRLIFHMIDDSIALLIILVAMTKYINCWKIVLSVTVTYSLFPSFLSFK